MNARRLLLLLPLTLAAGPTLAAPAVAAPPIAAVVSLPADALVASIPQRFSLPAVARAPGALRIARRFAVPTGGEVVRLQQVWRGLDVEDAILSVRLDAAGEVRWVSHDLAAIEVAGAAVATLPPAEAVRRAASLEGRSGAELPAALARLVWLRKGPSLVLAWRVTLPPTTVPYPSAPVRWLSAADGRSLRRDDRVRFQRQANVYLENPVSTPNLVSVTLALPDGALALENQDVLARNCLDQHATMPVTFQGFTVDVHMCSEVPSAAADVNGDFLDAPASDTEPEDTFAEVHAFHHVTRAFEVFRAFGFTHPSEWPLPTIVNFRIPIDPSQPIDAAAVQAAINPNGTLFPFDNAFFLPAGDSRSLGFDRPYDSIVFGQGTLVDFAYDGGIFSHEFGHAVVEATAGLGSVRVDAFGLDAAPGSLNEGYADFFAATIAGDPRMGEYAGRGFGAAGALRDATNTMTCPQDLWGEVHQDSNPFSGALWGLRSASASTFPFDAAVYTAMIGLPSLATFEQAAEATIAELGVAFDAAAAAEAREAFAARGLLGCNDRVVDANTHPVAFLEGTSTGLAPTPGYLQLRATLAERAGVVRVSAMRVDATLGGPLMGGGAPAPQIVLKRADAPVRFRYAADGSVTHDGDAVLALEQPAGSPPFEARFTGDFPAGPIHVAFLNAGDAGAQLSGIAVTIEPFVEGAGGAGGSGAGGAGGGGAGGSSAGGAGGSSAGGAGGDAAGGGGGDAVGGAGGSMAGEGGAPGPAADAGGGADEGGCGCGSSGRAPALELGGLLAALGLFFARQRRG